MQNVVSTGGQRFPIRSKVFEYAIRMSVNVNPQVSGRSKSSNRKTVLVLPPGKSRRRNASLLFGERKRKGMVRFRYWNPQFPLTTIPSSCLANLSSVSKGMA